MALAGPLKSNVNYFTFQASPKVKLLRVGLVGRLWMALAGPLKGKVNYFIFQASPKVKLLRVGLVGRPSSPKILPESAQIRPKSLANLPEFARNPPELGRFWRSKKDVFLIPKLGPE